MYLSFDVVVLIIKTGHWRIHIILGISSMYETTKSLVTAICRAISVLKPKIRSCFLPVSSSWLFNKLCGIVNHINCKIYFWYLRVLYVNFAVKSLKELRALRGYFAPPPYGAKK